MTKTKEIHKFKVNDWFFDESGFIVKVIELNDEGYLVESRQGHRYIIYYIYENSCRRWFTKDAKEGDVLVTVEGNPFIFWKNAVWAGYDNIIAYCGITTDGNFIESSCSSVWSYLPPKPATKEQRDLLFTKMNEAGYTWDDENKKLLELPIPKFKKGDEVVYEQVICQVKGVKWNAQYNQYMYNLGEWILESALKHNKNKQLHDISNFKPMQWVLVRDCDNQLWGLTRFSHRDMGLFVCLNREDFRQCIPYEGNEHLLGTNEPV